MICCLNLVKFSLKMIFSFTEPMIPYYRGFLPPSLQLDEQTKAESLLIRLLSGTIDLEHGYKGEKIEQRINYGILPYQEVIRVSAKPIRLCYSPKSLNDLHDYLVDNLQNNNYVESILTEVSHYFVAKENENHLSCFIHLYRLLEFISYSFPLAHASKASNIYGTFESLKEYFHKEGKELAFLKKFVNILFKDKPELNLTFEINITGITADIQKKIYQTFKRITAPKQDYITYDDTLFQLSLEYKNLIDLVVFLRNRYFHFAMGGTKNIKTSDIIDPDYFFEHINDGLLNWIYVIYSEIIKQK